MTKSVFCGIGSILCALMPFFAVAQKESTGQIKAVRAVANVAASPIDTESLLVQIDETFNYQPKWPENPVNPLDVPGPANNLLAGGLLSQPRTQVGGFFPAIGATGWTPPDPDLAVGPNHILATVNSSIAWFDRNGVKLFQQTSETFFSGMGAGTFQFDPKCFYDRVNQRFVILFLERGTSPQTSKLLFAVSDDNNPAGTWFRYRLEALLVIGGNNHWLDYPGFGYNKDAYVVSGNMFRFTSGFGGVQFIVIPKAPVLTGAAVTTTSFLHIGGSTTQIAEMISNTATNVYALSRNSTTSVRLYSINNPASSPTINFTSITVPASNGPGMSAQSTSGRTLDPIDSRIYNATWRNGRIVGAHNIQSGSFLGSRWYEVNTNNYPSGAPSLVQAGNITNAALHYFCPAISVNGYGDISAAFTGSSSSVTANLLLTGRNVMDSAGVMGAPQLLESSAGNDYSQFRWGDYFGVDVDPVDDLHFWGIGMTVAGNNAWRTSIFKWRVAPILKQISANPATIPAGGTSTLTVELTSPAGPGGVKVALSCNPRAMFPRMSTAVIIPEGQVSATTSLKSAPTIPGTATLTATLNGVTRTTTITVNP